MARYCEVEELLRARPTLEGAGVHLHRVFGFDHLPRLDPFLLLDDFGSEDPEAYLPGFPWHPHRGIETVTWMRSGEVEHGDSLGNEGVIGEGDVQWMTAGRGIVHQEMPRHSAEGLRGFQLWVNLPRSRKMMEPRYRDITSADIPTLEPAPGVRVRLAAGELGGAVGPAPDLVVPIQYFDLELEAGARWEHSLEAGHRAFAYASGGGGSIGGERPRTFSRRECARLGEGDAVRFEAGSEGMRLLFASGPPLNEPVAWGGPIVMNTREELREAFRQYQEGTFLEAE